MCVCVCACMAFLVKCVHDATVSIDVYVCVHVCFCVRVCRWLCVACSCVHGVFVECAHDATKFRLYTHRYARASPRYACKFSHGTKYLMLAYKQFCLCVCCHASVSACACRRASVQSN